MFSGGVQSKDIPNLKRPDWLGICKFYLLLQIKSARAGITEQKAGQ